MKIETTNIEIISVGGSPGVTYSINCPECCESIRVFDLSWRSQMCSCGYTWDVELKAVGYKEDNI